MQLKGCRHCDASATKNLQLISKWAISARDQALAHPQTQQTLQPYDKEQSGKTKEPTKLL